MFDLKPMETIAIEVLFAYLFSTQKYFRWNIVEVPDKMPKKIASSKHMVTQVNRGKEASQDIGVRELTVVTHNVWVWTYSRFE